MHVPRFKVGELYLVFFSLFPTFDHFQDVMWREQNQKQCGLLMTPSSVPKQ